MRQATNEQAPPVGARIGSRPSAAGLARLPSQLGNRAFGQVLARARDGIPSGRVHPSVAAVLARAAAPRDGRSLIPNELEDIEGRGPRLSRSPARTLQRLKITQVTPNSQLSTGDCGARNVQWIFSLDKPAPEDGYIVQHIEGTEDIVRCPGRLTGTMRKTSDFWEAWFVNRGDIVEWMMAAGRFDFTDGSTRGPSPSTNGVQVSDGTVKFFGKSTTGDLGKDSVAPADPASTWGPGRVPTSGALPSTPTKPTWWDNTPIEGPAIRQAKSEWNCCDADATKHTTRVIAYPPRPDRCEVKDWF